MDDFSATLKTVQNVFLFFLILLFGCMGASCRLQDLLCRYYAWFDCEYDQCKVFSLED